MSFPGVTGLVHRQIVHSRSQSQTPPFLSHVRWSDSLNGADWQFISYQKLFIQNPERFSALEFAVKIQSFRTIKLLSLVALVPWFIAAKNTAGIFFISAEQPSLSSKAFPRKSSLVVTWMEFHVILVKYRPHHFVPV